MTIKYDLFKGYKNANQLIGHTTLAKDDKNHMIILMDVEKHLTKFNFHL